MEVVALAGREFHCDEVLDGVTARGGRDVHPRDRGAGQDPAGLVVLPDR